MISLLVCTLNAGGPNFEPIWHRLLYIYV